MQEGKNEGNILINDTLNTFYLQLYVVRHMVKDIQIAIEETLCRHYMVYSFSLAARAILDVPSHRQDNLYHSIVTPVVEHWLRLETAQWVHHERSTHRTTSGRRSYHGATSRSASQCCSNTHASPVAAITRRLSVAVLGYRAALTHSLGSTVPYRPFCDLRP